MDDIRFLMGKTGDVGTRGRKWTGLNLVLRRAGLYKTKAY